MSLDDPVPTAEPWPTKQIPDSELIPELLAEIRRSHREAADWQTAARQWQDRSEDLERRIGQLEVGRIREEHNL